MVVGAAVAVVVAPPALTTAAALGFLVGLGRSSSGSLIGWVPATSGSRWDMVGGPKRRARDWVGGGRAADAGHVAVAAAERRSARRRTSCRAKEPCARFLKSTSP